MYATSRFLSFPTTVHSDYVSRSDCFSRISIPLLENCSYSFLSYFVLLKTLIFLQPGDITPCLYIHTLLDGRVLTIEMILDS